MCVYSSATSGVMSGPTMRCDGMSSRVALPDLKTASSLLKVSFPPERKAGRIVGEGAAAVEVLHDEATINHRIVRLERRG